MTIDLGEDSVATDTRSSARGRLRRLSLVAVCATLFLVFVGGYTRGSGSGYGCADRWPLCEDGALGGLLPRADYHMIIEWTHRWLAAAVGILVLATAVVAWLRQRDRRNVVWPATGAVLMIGVQAWTGRIVVAGQLDADLVSLHLAISMLVVGLLAVVAVNAVPDESGSTSPRTARDRSWFVLAAIGATGAYVVLLLGSIVHNRYVPGWPLVQNQLVPEVTDRWMAIHLVHRLVAGLGIVYLVYLPFVARRRQRPRGERDLTWAALGCYLLNVILGAAHVLTKVTSAVVVATHLLVAALVWTLLVAVAACAWRGRARAEVGHERDEIEVGVSGVVPERAAT